MQFGFGYCPYCGNTSGFVYVHGHYQCKQCNNNVMPCCGGEQELDVNKSAEDEKKGNAQD
jgi:hypothetical protein